MKCCQKIIQPFSFPSFQKNSKSFSKFPTDRKNTIFFDPPLRTSNKDRHTNRPRTDSDIENLKKFTFMPILAYEISQTINLKDAVKILNSNNFKKNNFPDDISSYSCSFSKKPDDNINEETLEIVDKNLFIFQKGTIVFWNFNEKDSQLLINLIEPSLVKPLSKNLHEMEELRFCVSKNSYGTYLVGEDIHLRVPDRKIDPADSENSHILDMLSVSDALSHSVKLNSIENNFDKLAFQMEPWIQSSKVFQRTGDLFALRHLLNITTSISDTPDVYWERPDLEALFKELKTKLNIPSRVRILNSKLDMCFELNDILTNHLQARHSSRLEWMIIILILVEVAFETIHFFRHQNQAAFEENEKSIA